jgi:hypothetical protein
MREDAMKKFLALLLLLCSPAGAQTVYFSSPPYNLLNFTFTDATQIMADYNRLVSDGNRVYNAFQAAITAAGLAQNQMPAGAIVPFKLASCPSGWLLADGNNGTPALVGRFIQSSSGSPAIGTVQNDQLLDHINFWLGIAGSGSADTSLNYTLLSITFGPYGFVGSGNPATVGNICALCFANPGPTGTLAGLETRPRNVALNFCMRVPGPPPGCSGTGLIFNVACNSQYLELGGSVM